MILNKKILNSIFVHIQVSKIFISLGITLSAMLGYLIFYPYADKIFWITALSSFLLCSGSGALNNYQDRNLDRVLKRTLNRPLPSGHVSPVSVLIQASIFILTGITGLCFTHNPVLSVFLALMGTLCYNAFYTPLKSRTILAILPGAICGMLPPLMGWAAAGGDLPFFPDLLTFPRLPISPDCIDCLNLPYSEKNILWVMTIIGVWQLPHFWLILLKHADDYEHQQHALLMLPSMLMLFSRKQLKRIMLIWVLLYSVILTMFPIYYAGTNTSVKWVVIFNGLFVLIFFLIRHFLCTVKYYGTEFMILNMSMFTLILVMIIDILK